MDVVSKSSKIDFPNLIALALQKSLPWDSLSIILDNVTFTEEEYKSLIKLLLKKLQKLQEKYSNKLSMKAHTEHLVEIGHYKN